MHKLKKKNGNPSKQTLLQKSLSLQDIRSTQYIIKL